MILVKAYEMSLLLMIALAFLASHARRRKERMMQPVKTHFPIVKGTSRVLDP